MLRDTSRKGKKITTSYLPTECAGPSGSDETANNAAKSIDSSLCARSAKIRAKLKKKAMLEDCQKNISQRKQTTAHVFPGFGSGSKRQL